MENQPTTPIANPQPSPSKPSLPSAKILIKETLETFKDRTHDLLPVYLIFGFVPVIGTLVKYLAALQTMTPIMLLFFALGLNVLLLLGTIMLILALKNKETKLEDLYTPSIRKLVRYFLLTFLLGLIVLAGMFLFIAPGIVFATWFVFAPYIFITEDTGIHESFDKSKYYVKDYFWPVFLRLLLFSVLLGIFYLAILFPLGFLVAKATLPTYYKLFLGTLIDFPLESLIAVLGIIFNYQLLTHLRSLVPPQAATVPPTPSVVNQ